MDRDGAAAAPGAVVWRPLLVTGTRYGAVAGALVALACLPWGWSAALSAALGAALGVAAFTVGPLLLRTVSQWSPPAVMGAALGGYMVIVFVLGLAYALLEPVGSLSHLHIGIALVVVALAETVGQMRAVAALRVLAFGTPDDAPRAAEIPGQRGERGEPHTPRD